MIKAGWFVILKEENQKELNLFYQKKEEGYKK